MKKLFMFLVILILCTGCSKTTTSTSSTTQTTAPSVDVQTQIDDTVVEPTIVIQPSGQLFEENDNYAYYLVSEQQESIDIYQNNFEEFDSSQDFYLHVEYQNKQTGEIATISEEYFNTYLVYEFMSNDKVFYSSRNFTVGIDDVYQGAFFCLDEKAQTFAPILSSTATYIASNEQTAYFYDYVDKPILISLDLTTLQSKYLVDLPDLYLTVDTYIEGEIIDDILYIRGISSDIITNEILFSTNDVSYTLSPNYTTIKFFKSNGFFTAFDATTQKIYTVVDIVDDIYLDETLYTCTEYIDGDKLIITSLNATNLSPVFSNSSYIEEYAGDCLSEHLYSVDFSDHSYSEFSISSVSRTDNDDGSTIFTYDYIYKPTKHFSTFLNDYQTVDNIEYKKAQFTVKAYYIIDRYIIDSVSNISNNTTYGQTITLYQTDDFAFESQRILQSYADSPTDLYSTGEYIYGYLKSNNETLDLAQTEYNTFFLDTFSDKIFLTSSKAPTFTGYNNHKISYIDLTNNQFIMFDPTVSVFAIKDYRAYYIDENYSIGYFSFASLTFNTLADYTQGGDIVNGAYGYIENDILYVKLYLDGGNLSNSSYQQVSLK